MLRVERFVRATHSGRAEGHSPFAEDLGVSPNLNCLESLFVKEGLTEFGATGSDRHHPGGFPFDRCDSRAGKPLACRVLAALDFPARSC